MKYKDVISNERIIEKRVIFFKAAQLCPICPNWPVSDLYTVSNFQALLENDCPYIDETFTS